MPRVGAMTLDQKRPLPDHLWLLGKPVEKSPKHIGTMAER
jgi:hypothetical protein